MKTIWYIGYEVHWEEESTVVSCIHTLSEASIDFEVNFIFNLIHSLDQFVSQTVPLYWTVVEQHWICVGGHIWEI